MLEFLRTGWARGQGKVPLWLVHCACSASAAAPWNQTAAEGAPCLPGCARCLEGGVVVSQIRIVVDGDWLEAEGAIHPQNLLHGCDSVAISCLLWKRLRYPFIKPPTNCSLISTCFDICTDEVP